MQVRQLLLAERERERERAASLEAIVLTVSACAVVDGQPESTWHAAGATARLAYHPLLHAPCVRAWLRRNHAVCSNISSGRCQRTAHEAALGTTVVKHDSWLLRCHLADDARPGATLHVTELLGMHSRSWPLPQGPLYNKDLGQPFCFSEPDGVLAIRFGGRWEDQPDSEHQDELGVVLVDIVTGACTSFLLPPQDLDFCATLEGWSRRPAACLFVQLVQQVEGQFLDVLLAYSLDGELVSTIYNPSSEGYLATVSNWDPADRTVALAAHTSAQHSGVWLWSFRSGKLVGLGVRERSDTKWLGCMFSPCSSMILCPAGDGLDLMEVSSQSVLQHVAGVCGGMGCWSHMGACCVVDHAHNGDGHSSVHLLSLTGAALASSHCIQLPAKVFWGGLVTLSEDGRYALLLAGSASQGQGELCADFELVIIDMSSGRVMRHSIAFMPAWFNWYLGDSVAIAADATAQKLLVLDFRSR